MARYYRRRRRWGRRRYLRRRFGAGGGNRKRPSSYAVAYGFTKQFDKIIGKYANVGEGVAALGDIYGNMQFLVRCARLFLESNITTVDRTYLDTLYTGLGEAKKTQIENLVSELFNGVLVNHTDEPMSVTVESVRHVPAERAARYTDEKETLLQVFKTQFKDSLQRVTKRNLPLSLAVSSWCLSYLKNKKRRRKYLNFWKFKSVPRFIILITLNLKSIWGSTKYGRSLDSLLSEIDFLKQTATTRRLLMLAKAGVANAQEELERITSTSARNTISVIQRNAMSGLNADAV